MSKFGVERLLIDTATVYYRAFFALPQSLVAPDGQPNNALRGTLTTFTALIKRFNTCSVIPAWDAAWRPAWRVQHVPTYKTHRVAASGEEESEPDTLGPQIGGIADLLAAVGLPPIGLKDFEADDVIGTLARLSKSGAVIVTSDRDLIQCVDDALAVRIMFMVPGGMDKWIEQTACDIVRRFGVTPAQYVDYAVLRGDPSDGLPGVPGVGEKTARALIETFGSIESIIAASSRTPVERPLTPRIAERIQPAELRGALHVTRVRDDLDLTPPDPWQPTQMDSEALISLGHDWGVDRQIAGLVSALECAHNPPAK